MNRRRVLADKLINAAFFTSSDHRKPGIVVEKFRNEPELKNLTADDFQDVRREYLGDGPPTIAGKPRIWRIF